MNRFTFGHSIVLELLNSKIHILSNSVTLAWFFPSPSANHRRAGHAVTNILAKELMKDDSPVPSKIATNKPRVKEEPKLEGADSLEELLDAAASRSS